MTLLSEPGPISDPATRDAAVACTTFGPLEVRYDTSVLAPRPWTLAQARWAVDLLRTAGPGDVLELCAGVGHIGHVVALESGRRVVQVDASARACELAAANAASAGITPDIRTGDIADVLDADERFVFVIADPPYVPTEHLARFPEDPREAIDGGDDGLRIARRCVTVGRAHLTDGGFLLLQMQDGPQAFQFAREVESLAPVTVHDLRVMHGYGALLLLRAVTSSIEVVA